MQDKLEKVREFIQANPGKSNRWYADNNGVIKKTTFYKYLNDIVMDRSMDTQTDNESASASTSEIIENLFDEHEKNEDRKSKNRRYNYNTRSRKALVEELQKENEELKSKYEELKTDFIFERQLKEKYANQIHDLPFKQSEFDELKKKYDNLQIEYITLKTGDKPQNKPDKSDKSEIKNQTQWWEEL